MTKREQVNNRALFWRALCKISNLLLLLALPYLSHAGKQSKIEELRHLISTASADEKGELYLSLSKAYGLDQPAKALDAAKRAIEQGTDLDDWKIVCEGDLLAGTWSLYTAGEVENSRLYLNAALKATEQHKDRRLEVLTLLQLSAWAWRAFDIPEHDSLIAVLSNIEDSIRDPALRGRLAIARAGIAYEEFRTEEAQEQYQQAIEYLRGTDQINGLLQAKLGLATLHLRIRDNETAAELYSEALAEAEERELEYWQLRLLMRQSMFLSFARDFTTETELEEKLQRIDELARNTENEYALVQYNYFVCRRLRDIGNGDTVLSYAKESYRLSQVFQMPAGTVQAGIFLSGEYKRQGRLEQALDILLEIKDLSLQIDYRVEQLLGRIANCYMVSGEPEKALRFRKQGIAYEKQRVENPPPYFFFYYYSDLGNIYLEMDSLEKAGIYQDSALAVGRAEDNASFVARAMTGKAHVYISAGDYAKAEQELVRILAVTDSVADKDWIYRTAEAHSLGARLYFNLKDYQACIYHAEKAIETGQEIGHKVNETDNYEWLWKAHEALGQYEQAFLHLTTYNTLQDSISSEKAKSKLQALKEQYKADQKQLEIDLLTQDKVVSELRLASKEQALQRRNLLLWILSGLVLTVFIFGWLIFNRYKLRKTTRELQLQNKQYELEQENMNALRIAEMAELRSSILANVSHEIRTPLTLIKGPLEEWKQDPSKIQTDAIHRMDNNANRLLALIDEGLNAAKTVSEAPRLQRKVIDVVQFFREQVSIFKPQALQQEVSIRLIDEIDDGLFSLDISRMERLIANLMSNALRYTPRGGSISITLQQTDRGLTIVFTDTGIGIAEDNLPHVFERHYRADDDPTTGHGLGLSIVKEIVEQHQGDIDIESVLGQGTTFTIHLPSHASIKEPEAPLTGDPMTTPMAPANDGDEPMVLIIEDNPDVKNYLSSTLGEEYQIITADDGAEGELMAQKHLPDVIISDIAMPRMDGLELTEKLKAEFLTSHIPIVLLTAKTTHDDKLRGLKVGADQYLAKPFSPLELKLCLKNLLSQQEQMRKHFESTHSAKPNPAAVRTAIDQAFLDKALKTAEKHLDNPELSIEEFCSDLALNRTSVHLKLKALTGKNTTGFIKSVRIRKAAELIQTSTYSLSEIGDRTGFNNRQTFQRAFKEHMKMTPSEYRNKALLAGSENSHS